MNGELLAVHVAKRYGADECAAEAWCGQVFVLSPGECEITTRWADQDQGPDSHLPMCAECLPHLDQGGLVPLGIEVRVRQ
ncbi:MAG: hypothetical protein F4171_06415 [Gammaproteobacteria bacterium]|nr:hypothetical protein [Gammaproteobacteria bacterium]MYG12416.1 hypothetical protein [Gammaproteobacteria bacterium]MYK29829.1 hypothetical protein [Gammaproteobacteria bacterium]